MNAVTVVTPTPVYVENRMRTTGLAKRYSARRPASVAYARSSSRDSAAGAYAARAHARHRAWISNPEAHTSFRRRTRGGRAPDATAPLCTAHLVTIYNRLRLRGILKSNRPTGLCVFVIPDTDIVAWFQSVAFCILRYYGCCYNLYYVKRCIQYHIRVCALLTLAGKHQISTKPGSSVWQRAV